MIFNFTKISYFDKYSNFLVRLFEISFEGDENAFVIRRSESTEEEDGINMSV